MRRSAGGGRPEGDLAGRVPPSDLSAEKAVLSAILLDNESFHEIVTEISAEDFYHPAHAIVYGSMAHLRDANQPVDLTTLAAHLTAAERLEAVGGAMMLAELADYEATPANVVHYAKIVRDKSIKRSLIHVASEIVGIGYDAGESAEELLDQAESRIFALSQVKARATLSSLFDEMQSAMDHVDMLRERSGELTGLPSGFKAFDEISGGLQGGDLMILAARPSMGKTALCLNIARNAAVDHGKKVAIFSLEMTTRALVLRLLSSEARVDFGTFRSGHFTDDAYDKLTSAASVLADAPIFIDETASASILEIRAKSRRLHAIQGGVDLVIVDYLQLAKGDARTPSREQEISEISRGLKGLAKELNVPVIALSQLNRGPETRKEDKRPMLADLRESGAIEQDADLIAFIYRDVVYNRETEHEDLAELIVGKQRNGPTGTIKLRFTGRFAQFTDWHETSDPYDNAPGASAFSPMDYGDPEIIDPEQPF